MTFRKSAGAMETHVDRPNWRKRLLNGVSSGIGGRKWRATIETDAIGITVTRLDVDGTVSTEHATWDEISGAIAYKRDCYAYDQIRIELMTGNGSVLATEGMEGWLSLLETLPAYLPEMPPKSEWWAKVAFPPFATNMTMLFSRRTAT
jgi:hypothetical protein